MNKIEELNRYRARKFNIYIGDHGSGKTHQLERCHEELLADKQSTSPEDKPASEVASEAAKILLGDKIGAPVGHGLQRVLWLYNSAANEAEGDFCFEDVLQGIQPSLQSAMFKGWIHILKKNPRLRVFCSMYGDQFDGVADAFADDLAMLRVFRVKNGVVKEADYEAVSSIDSLEYI